MHENVRSDWNVVCLSCIKGLRRPSCEHNIYMYLRIRRRNSLKQRIHSSRHERIIDRIAFFGKKICKSGDLSPAPPKYFCVAVICRVPQVLPTSWIVIQICLLKFLAQKIQEMKKNFAMELVERKSWSLPMRIAICMNIYYLLP